jgi:hypothetical protein
VESSQSLKNGNADAADAPQMAADQKISAKIYQICAICVLSNHFDVALLVKSGDSVHNVGGGNL